MIRVLGPTFGRRGSRLKTTDAPAHHLKQQTSSYSTQKVIPNFREAAAAALGEKWASTPPGWFEPGGDKPSFVDGDDRSSSIEGDGENGGRGSRTRTSAYSRAQTTPRSMRGRREAAAPTPRGTDVEVGPARPSISPTAPGRDITTPPATGRALVERVSRGGASMAPFSEPSHRDGSDGGARGRSSNAGVARENSTGSNKRPYTTERNNAKDLAQYLGVPGPDNDSGSSRTGGIRGGGKRGVGELTLAAMSERDKGDREGDEGQVSGNRQGVRRSRALNAHGARREPLEEREPHSARRLQSRPPPCA